MCLCGTVVVERVRSVVNTAREGGCQQVALLHCVSGYPAPAADYNLRTIPDMAERFGTVVGLSDHTLDNATAIAIAIVALGASIIEKHVSLDRSGGGPDDSSSLESSELKALCDGARTAWEVLGAVDYGRKSNEQGSMKFRRSLYFVRDLNPGDVIDESAVKRVRPGYGLSPKHLSDLMGRQVKVQVAAGTPVTAAILLLPPESR